MSQHVELASEESHGSWLPLTEYSVRSGISTSTIRRKIKSNSIRYRLIKGKYYIHMGESTAPAPIETMPVKIEPKPVPTPQPVVQASKPIRSERPKKVEVGETSLSLIDRAVKMVSDAFEQTIKEKDARITLLKEQNRELQERLNELKTLVQALEEKYEVRY